MGVVPLQEALKQAQARELDLIEISPNAKPPVCKIMALAKYRYELEQKQKKAKKKQKEIEIKEFRLRLNIFQNDLETRLKRIEEFLQKGDKIKISIMFRGRENSKKQLGYDLAHKILNYFGTKIMIDKHPEKRGSVMFFVFGPNKKS